MQDAMPRAMRLSDPEMQAELTAAYEAGVIEGMVRTNMNRDLSENAKANVRRMDISFALGFTCAACFLLAAYFLSRLVEGLC